MDIRIQLFEFRPSEVEVGPLIFVEHQLHSEVSVPKGLD